jgi:hypothetical protein
LGEREGEQTSLKVGKRRRSHERDPIRAGDPMKYMKTRQEKIGSAREKETKGV